MTNTKTFLCRLTVSLLLALTGVTLVRQHAAAQALQEADPAAVKAIEAWLNIMDQGRYLQSWISSSAQFKKSITSTDWVNGLNTSRKPLGACTKRTLAAAMPQDSLPASDGQMLKGEFVIAQFRSSFANLNAAIETVTFEKENGIWKASGYFLRPDK